MMQAEKVGELIKNFCQEKLKLSKNDYKRVFGVEYGTMHKYFDGERLPGFIILQRLHNAGFDILTLFEKSKIQNKPSKVNNKFGSSGLSVSKFKNKNKDFFKADSQKTTVKTVFHNN